METKRTPAVTAESEEWLSYYRSAARRASGAGDPFRRHLERLSSRERLLVIASLLTMVAISAMFLHVVG